MLDLRPNWSRQVEVSIAFKTEIITARNGSEQRRALRDSPRKRIVFQALKYGEDRQQQIFSLNDFQRVASNLPDPTREAIGTAVATDEITVDAVHPWMTVGAKMAIDRAQMVEIDAIAGNVLTVSAPPVNSAPLSLRPMLTGYLASDINIASRTSRVWEIPLAIEVSPGSEYRHETEDGLYVHAGRRVWCVAPNWQSTNEYVIRQQRQTIDFGHGVVEHLFPVGYGDRLQSWLFSPLVDAETDYLNDMFQYARGRAGEFMLPTFHEDATPLVNLEAGAASILVADSHLLGMESDPVHRFIQIALNDGRVWFRTVIDSDASGGDVALTVNRNFVEDVAPSQIKHICLMSVARFANDELVVEYETDSVASIKTNFISLPVATSEDLNGDLAPEVLFMIEMFRPENAGDFMDIIDVRLNITWADIFDV